MYPVEISVCINERDMREECCSNKISYKALPYFSSKVDRNEKTENDSSNLNSY
jgi:hypothetical protein